MMHRLAIAALALTLASCGRVADLEPQAGKTLPQKPALASRPLDADELLALPTHAVPRRVDELNKRGDVRTAELNKRGDVRTADRFDLPPPDGTAVPPAAATDEDATPSTTGPDNQDIPR
jgi:hypothetical protein